MNPHNQKEDVTAYHKQHGAPIDVFFGKEIPQRARELLALCGLRIVEYTVPEGLSPEEITKHPRLDSSRVIERVVLNDGSNKKMSRLRETETLTDELPHLVEEFRYPDGACLGKRETYLVKGDKPVIPGSIDLLESRVVELGDDWWMVEKTYVDSWSSGVTYNANELDERLRPYLGNEGRVVTESRVAPGTLPDDLTGDLISSVVERETCERAKKTNTELKGGFVDLVIKHRYPDGACLATTEVKVITLVGGEVPDPPNTFYTIESRVEQINEKYAIRRHTYVDAWPTRTHYEEDPTTGERVTVTHTMVAPSSPPSPTAGKHVQQTPVTCNRDLRVTRSITTPAEENFCRQIKYTFPAYLIPGNEATTSAVLVQGRTVCKLNLNRRSEFTRTVKARVSVTYHATKPACSELFQWRPVDLIYQGILFSVNERYVLTDGFTLTANTHSEDTYYGFAVESTTFLPSTPTATAYAALIGTEVLVAEETQRWNYNLYRRERIFIYLE